MVVSVGGRGSNTPWLRATASRRQTWCNSWAVFSQPYRYANVKLKNFPKLTLCSLHTHRCCVPYNATVALIHS